ncbi:MAG: hypothetical protein LBK75_04585 [Oscillospiraceae bacterium]|jgi:hypothetical protein|nr:hypothetical protein [Oscillospiraceae bacterium]
MEQAINLSQRFTVETKTVYMQGKPITLTSRTPVLTPEQREKRKREIEARLYDICRKYQMAQAHGMTNKNAGKP